MSAVRPPQTDSFHTSFDGMEDPQSRLEDREDWEDWQSDEGVSEYNGHNNNESDGEESLVGQRSQSVVRRQSDFSNSSETGRILQPSSSASRRSGSTMATQSVARSSIQKPSRLKSRARQKAQNAKAGIHLVTDMSKFRKQQQQRQHQLQQLQQLQQQQQQARSNESRPGKFVDAAALRALEGKPSDTSVGSWHWLKRKATTSSSPSPLKDNSAIKSSFNKDSTPVSGTTQDLSPGDRPIVIGISLPEGDLEGRTISPYTATIETPADIPSSTGRTTSPLRQLHQKLRLQHHNEQKQPQLPTDTGSHHLSPNQLRSVWSPDSDDVSPDSAGASQSRVASSVYSQPDFVAASDEVPPLPVMPLEFRTDPGSVPISAALSGRAGNQTNLLHLDDMENGGDNDDDNDDDNSPITLFEEDGMPGSRRQSIEQTSGNQGRSATTVATSHSGWWDHVRTPFTEHSASPLSARALSPTTPASAKTPLSAASSALAANTIPAVPSLPPVPVSLSTSSPTSGSQQFPQFASSPRTGDEWWKSKAVHSENVTNAQNTKSAGVLTNTHNDPRVANRPPLGVSTTVANAHAFRQLSVSPTIASSSRSPGLSEGFVSPPEVAHAQTSEKAITAFDTGREMHSSRDNQVDRNRNETPLDNLPSDAPPPYEPGSRSGMPVRYRAVFPPGHPLRSDFPPSPGPMSPGLAFTMTSQGAIHMSDVPLTPHGAQSVGAAAGRPLPSQPASVYFPGPPTCATSVTAAKAERKRRRHEKEDALTRRAGGFWRGRGCFPESGCFGRRGGREARKRRRVCLGIVGGILAAIILIVVLAVTLSRHHTPQHPVSFWLNITNFPPVPTGLTTVVGTENSQTVSGCVQPPTLWSCSLPKEQQGANLPFPADAPNFFLQIQFDNSSQRLWDVPDGKIPTPVPLPTASKTTVAAATATATQTFDTGFTPQPVPPSFQEMWFLGNTTDDVVSDKKAGEPTPFYITFLQSLNSSIVGPNEVDDPHGGLRLRRSSDIVVNERGSIAPGAGGNASSLFPAPDVNPDGTGAAAVMHPLPVQQPLRLFDRGLPTEHYGFYSYFSKTIYVQSITPGASSTNDDDGGAFEAESEFVVTWLQTRFLVQIWTRLDNSTRMIGNGQASNSTQPGTFPYPITITEDLHGGNFDEKGVFARVVDSKQHVLLANASPVFDNLNFGGTLINHASNPSFGGSDGGTGGCVCRWANFIGVNGNTVG